MDEVRTWKGPGIRRNINGSRYSIYLTDRDDQLHGNNSISKRKEQAEYKSLSKIPRRPVCFALRTFSTQISKRHLQTFYISLRLKSQISRKILNPKSSLTCPRSKSENQISFRTRLSLSEIQKGARFPDTEMSVADRHFSTALCPYLILICFMCSGTRHRGKDDAKGGWTEASFGFWDDFACGISSLFRLGTELELRVREKADARP